MRAIAKAMGFPPATWFANLPGDKTLAAAVEGKNLAARVESLFGMVRHPRTGAPYTSAEVARMSVGVLTEGEVEGIRTGKVPDPTVGQVAALAAVFGVSPSYLLDWGKGQLVPDDEVLGALSDETAAAILRESSCLSGREKRIVLGIVREFENHGSPPDA